MAISGLSTAESLNNPSQRRPMNVREGILRLYPTGGKIQNAPLTALTAAMRSAPTDDPRYWWFEKGAAPRRFKIGANFLVGATTITLDSGAFAIPPNAVLLVEETQELIFMAASATSDTSITVSRGFAGSTAAAYTAGTAVNPWLIVVGTAFEEGSLAPDPVGFDPTEEYNYCQIFRETYGLTNTADATRTLTGATAIEAKRDCLETFSVDMERAFLFGKKYLATYKNRPLRTTDGLFNSIQNKIAVNGAIDYDWWEQNSEQFFRLGSNEKLAFIGARTMTAIHQMVRKNTTNMIKLSDAGTEYGMKGFRRLSTPHGDLVLKVHPLMALQQGGAVLKSGTYTGLDNSMLILDMADIRYRFLKGRDIKHESNLQVAGQDGMLSGFIGECGLEVNHKSKHWVVTGITGGVKDA